MQKDLQTNLSKLEGLIGISADCVTEYNVCSDYLIGMHNGLVLAHSIFAKNQPKFKVPPVPKNRKLKSKIRHKSNT